jgi:Domain of unknown function (DUF4136)
MRLLFTMLLLASVGFSCSRLFVENDYKYTENFDKYNTYAFVDCERDTSYLCEDVQSAIERQMEARGYEFNAQKPNLLIHFSIYYDNLRYQGFDQPSLMNWVATQDEDFKYRPIKYELSKGTIMISLLEADKGEIVWRGYATGIFNKKSKQTNYFKNVVRSIFDQYPLTTVKVRRIKKTAEARI